MTHRLPSPPRLPQLPTPPRLPSLPLPKPIDKQSTNPWRIPWDAQVELAKIRMRLAEQRYRIMLQRGKAWDVISDSNRRTAG